MKFKDIIKPYKTNIDLDATEDEKLELYNTTMNVYLMQDGFKNIKDVKYYWSILTDRQKFIVCNDISREGLSYFNLLKYFI